MNIPTAEELMYRYRYTDKSLVSQQDKALGINRVKSLKDTRTLMIEFAKLHVEAALKAAKECVKFEVKDHDGYSKDITDFINIPNDYQEYGGSIVSYKDNIPDSYPLSNIK